MNSFVARGVRIASLGLLVQVLPAHAARLQDLQVDGFLTAAATVTDTGAAAFLGARDEVRFDIDSVFGLQFTAPVNERARATVQVNGHGSDDFRPETEWAYLTWKATDAVDLKAGRQRIPFFMISDFLEVGYAYPWVRPPVDVYSQLGFSRFDGVSASWRHVVGGWMFTAQPFVGSTRDDQVMSMRDATGAWADVSGKLDVTRLAGLNLTFGNDDLTFRLGRTEGDFDLTGMAAVDQYLAGVTAYGFPAVADKFGVRDRHGWFQGAGIEADFEGWGFLGEYTERGTDGLIADSSGWYVTVLAHAGRFTPYAGFSRLRTEEDYAGVRAVLDDMAAIPDPDGAGPAPSGAALAAATQQFIALSSQDEDSVFAGLRYALGANLALKCEWQRIEPENRSTGVLQQPDAGFDRRHVNVYTVALDAIF